MKATEAMTMQKALGQLIGGSDLSREQARAVMGIIMNGEATASQIAGVFTALRMKGETKDEITGFAEAMRELSSHVLTEQEGLLDTCGTGGSGIHKFNISTASAMIAARGRHPGCQARQQGDVGQGGQRGRA